MLSYNKTPLATFKISHSRQCCGTNITTLTTCNTDYCCRGLQKNVNLKESKTVNHVVFRVERYPVVQTDSYCLHLDMLCGTCKINITWASNLYKIV